jgi:hypothetical protein
VSAWRISSRDQVGTDGVGLRAFEQPERHASC